VIPLGRLTSGSTGARGFAVRRELPRRGGGMDCWARGPGSRASLFRLAALLGLAAHLLDDVVTAGQRLLRFEDLGDVQPDAPTCDPCQGAFHVVRNRLERAPARKNMDDPGGN
jgi:hypothetical protein